MSPSRIRLEFSEIVEPAVAHVSLVGPDGTATMLAVANDPHDAHVIVATPGPLGPGTYRVEWHVLSEDGHPVGASFVFTVGSATTPPPVEAQSIEHPLWGPSIAGAPLIPSALRALGVGSFAALSGLLLFLVTTRTGLDARAARMTLWFAIVAPILLGGHLFAWVINASPDHRIDVAWLSSAFSTTVGRTELWRTLLSLLPLWALLFARRAGLALLVTVPTLILSAAIGHSAAFQPFLSVPLKAVHLVAMGAWVGGLLWLVVDERQDARSFAANAARVSSIALTSVVALTISGVIQVVILIPSLAGLRSAYGATVLAKVVGLGVLVAFGAYHRQRVLPRLAADSDGREAFQFQASLRREIMVLWLVILLGGFLGYVSPPAAVTVGQLNAQESTP